MPNSYTENNLVEQPALVLFDSLQWETLDCYDEFDLTGGSPLGRETKSEVILFSRLRSSLKKINPDVSDESIEHAIEELTKDPQLS